MTFFVGVGAPAGGVNSPQAPQKYVLLIVLTLSGVSKFVVNQEAL